MNFEKALVIADELVSAKTGKHLSKLQKAILEASWEGHTYNEIAYIYGYAESHIKEVGSRLWKILSDVLGEEVRKSNVRYILERLEFSTISLNVGSDFAQINNVIACAKPLQPPEVAQDRSGQVKNPVSPINRVSVDDAPDIGNFYDRTKELTILEKWIVQERCRLVALLGISGIGKTALAVQLVEQIKDKFEYVIWQSLCYKPPLAQIQKTLIQFISNQQEIELAVSAEGRLSQLIEYLRKHRCLVILDDVHSVFSNGQLAGCYEPGYQDYGLLFRRIGELYHNSCLVLTSWDKPREIVALEGENKPVRSLQLDGLDMASAREILRKKGLAEEEKWDDLIKHYQGNPLWLKIMARMIQDLFGGSVSELIKYDTILLNEDLKDILNQQFNGLSELEEQVMSVLAKETEFVSISKLLEHIELAPAELFNAMQSLGRRSLIEKVKQGNQNLFNLQPVVREYVKTEILH